MVSLVLLPDELLLAILTEAAYVRSIKRALRLRLVCKSFTNIATTAIFDSSILNRKEMSNQIHRAPEFWAEYLAYLTLTHAHRKTMELTMLLLVAQHICRYRHASRGETYVLPGAIKDDALKECVLELSKMATLPKSCAYMIGHWPAAASVDEVKGEKDKPILDFKRHLLSAAAWIGEESLVAKLLEEGCNYFGGGPSLFLEPIRAASYRGHVGIVKLLILDDCNRAPHGLVCPTLIVNYFNDHTKLLDLTLGPSWHRCEVEPHNTHKLRLLALGLTRNLETFKRLLADAKPHMAESISKELARRLFYAAEHGCVDIVKYLIEEEMAEVNDENNWDDKSVFQSRYPAKFHEGFMREYRAHNLVSLAARGGHKDTVQILLDARAEQNHSIEFAAMCGSRTLVKLLWEHRRYNNTAVQGALVMAVDREDTAMFNLLIELGAKLDDDVRVAMIQKAQEEGLESMVTLLHN